MQSLYEKFEHEISSISLFESNPTVALALSGGVDSMVLCHLLNKWIQKRQGKLLTLTVDHCLRDESTTECLEIKEYLSSKNIPHIILTWNWKKDLNLPFQVPNSAHKKHLRNIQEQARNNRYNLLEEYCSEHNILHLFSAHHKDDLWETALMRAKRTPNLAQIKITPIQRVQYLKAIRLIRPLLKFSKKHIIDYAIENNIKWFEDKSNTELNYERNLVRAQIISERVRTDNSNLNNHALHNIVNKLELESPTYRQEFQELPDISVSKFAIGKISSLNNKQLLRGMLMTIGNKDYPPSLKKIELITEYFNSGKKQIAISNCIIKKISSYYKIYKENRNKITAISLKEEERGNTIIWDERFKIEIPQDILSTDTLKPMIDYKIKNKLVLYDDGIEIDLSKILKVYDLEYINLITLPAIWRGDKILYSPLEYKKSNNKNDLKILKFNFYPRRPISGKKINFKIAKNLDFRQ